MCFAAGDRDLIAQVVLPENADRVRFAACRVATSEGILDISEPWTPKLTA